MSYFAGLIIMKLKIPTGFTKMTLLKILISGLENIDQQTLRVEQVIFFPINFEPQTARLKRVSLLNSRE